MSAPAGWYPDPQTPVPGAPPQQRYWDGKSWTQHVSPVAPRPGDPQPGYGPPGYGQQYPQAIDRSSAAQSYAQQPNATQSYAGTPAHAGPATTPDGVPLAGWWHRVGAYLIDSLILGVLIAVVAFPFIADVLGAFGDYFDKVMTAAENGSPTPSATQLTEDIGSTALVIAAIGLIVNFLYAVAFLTWKQATPGKLAVGLRVRLRERPDLPVSAICLRWVVQFLVPGVLGQVPYFGFVFNLFWFLDHLWPLWDPNKQALHDKAAKTNVVRVR